MNVRYALFSLIFVLTLGLISYKATHALFSDTAESTHNTFTAAEVFPTITPSPTLTPDLTGIATHVVISEVAYDQVGGDTFSFVELYNPKATDEDISGWKIVGVNGADGSDYVIATVPSETTLPAHKYYLVGEGVIPNSITVDVTLSDNLQNGPDAVELRGPDDSVIDALGYGFDGEGTAFTDVDAGHSIERKALSTSGAVSMASGGTDELKGNGYDTDNNINDFTDRVTPQPQNSASLAEMP